MVQIVKQTAQAAHYTVLRAIYVAGERVEPGASVELTPVQYAELKSANKVGPLVAPPAKPAKAKAEKIVQPDEVKS